MGGAGVGRRWEVSVGRGRGVKVGVIRVVYIYVVSECFVRQVE